MKLIKTTLAATLAVAMLAVPTMASAHHHHHHHLPPHRHHHHHHHM